MRFCRRGNMAQAPNRRTVEGEENNPGPEGVSLAPLAQYLNLNVKIGAVTVTKEIFQTCTQVQAVRLLEGWKIPATHWRTTVYSIL